MRLRFHGVKDHQNGSTYFSRMSSWKAESEERKSRVCEKIEAPDDTRVLRDTRNLVGSRGDHPPSLNTFGDR